MVRTSALGGVLGCALSALSCAGPQKAAPPAPAAPDRAPPAAPFTLNADGRDLIARGAQASREDLAGRPLVEDRAFQTYLERLATGLVPRGKALPEGVRITVAVVESRKPELYSYVNGTIVVATGLVLAADDEAQLAALLSHEVAHVAEAHYLALYQQIKAAERSGRRKALAAGIFGTLLDAAVDYTVEVETSRQYDKLMKGKASYLGTAESVAKITAAEHVYYGLKDVIAGIPAKDETGDWIDPRQRFEVVADAQGMIYLAQAGYDVEEASRAWGNVRRINSAAALAKQKAMGPYAEKMREVEDMMRLTTARMRQSMGAGALVQTISEAPPERAELAADLVKMKEVQEALQGGAGRKGVEEYRAFLRTATLPKADRALAAESYGEAELYYRALYDKGLREPGVAYGLARSSMGDFAFSASDAQKREAEKLYLQAAAGDDRFAPAYRGLGELYEEWERYAEAARAYQGYLKRAPQADDRARVQRKIETLKRKASR